MNHYLDLRAFSANIAAGFITKSNESMKPALTAWQLAALPEHSWLSASRDIVVTVPDFLNYARMLNTGQELPLARLPGSLKKSGLAGLRCAPLLVGNLLRLARMDFWLIAETLLRYDLALLPRNFTGMVLLHGQLSDFAWAADRRKFIERYFQLVPRRCRTGISTQQPGQALSCLARWNLRPDVISFLAAPNHAEQAALFNAVSKSEFFANTQWLAEVDSWPRDWQSTDQAAPRLPKAVNGILTLPAQHNY